MTASRRRADQQLTGTMRGMTWIVAGTFSQAVGGAAQKVLVVTVPNVQTLVFLRALVALALLLPAALASRGRAIKTKNAKLHVIRGVLLAINGFCSTYAVTRLTLAEANTYGLSTSLFLLPFGALFLGERAHYMRWAGGAVGFVGVLIMLRPGFSGFQWAAVVALIGALANALLSVVLKRVSSGDSTVAINFWSLTASVMIFGVLTGFHVPTLPVTLWGWVLLGGCCALAMRFCYIFGYRAGEASAVEVGSFALLLWAALIGLTLFGELPPLHFWIGAIVTVAGITLVMIEPPPHDTAAQSS